DADDEEDEEARESAGLAAEEVQQHQPGEDGEAHSRSPSGAGCSGASSLPIARIDRLKASGCWRLLVGDDVGHRPVLAEGPAFTAKDIAVSLASRNRVAEASTRPE